MNQPPPGWAHAAIGDLGHVMLGRQRAPKYHSGSNMRPYLRVKNVFEDRIDLRDVKEMDFSPLEYERYKLEPGDILLNEGQSPEFIGRPAMYRGELPGACFTNSLIRFRPYAGIDGKFALYLFRHLLHSGRFRREARITTNIAHLSSGRFQSIEVIVPPVAEQRRIVAAIEEHLSRLDAGRQLLGETIRELEALRRSALHAELARDWPRRRLGEVADTQLGKMLSGKAHGGQNSRPYLRNKNVQWSRIDVFDLLEMNFSESETEKFELVEGDVLVCEGGEVGRAAIWHGEVPGCCFQKALHRVRPHPELMAEFVVIVLRWFAYRNELAPHVTGSTIAHLPQEDIRRLEIPLPSRAEQEAIVERVHSALDSVDRMHKAAAQATRQGERLKGAVLNRAMLGELVPQDPTDEPASVLLEGLEAERAAAPTPTRKERTPA